MSKKKLCYQLENEFDVLYTYDDFIERSFFRLHNHLDTFEILYFIRGSAEFCVEGSVYPMEPYTVALSQSNEMHRMRIKDETQAYERIVINIDKSFFIKNDCEEFKGVFTDRPLGVGNIFTYEELKKHNIDKIFADIKNYCECDNPHKGIVLRSKLIELLYNMASIRTNKYKQNYHNEKIKNILLYINDNIRENLTLEKISEHFFHSKYHMCHIFKQHTGMTINQYIAYKRILLVREMYEKGLTLLDASIEAGFSDYSVFYKQYVKQMGKSPREDLLIRQIGKAEDYV
ncbi:MAG: helix-turn-helix transcriptional regulator [Clostridia bacterium]|nr:helix-turn-helix transcriptional regulator [Clostridia bacterium]